MWKSRDITLLIKVHIVKAMVFPVVTYSYKSWTMKKAVWCLQTVVLEKTPENPLDSKEIKSVNLKGNKPWILTGRTDAEAEAPIFWSPDVNSQLIGKVPDAGRDWEQEKGTSKDEMAGWHHWCNEHELGANSGRWWVTGRTGICGSWGCKKSDKTGWPNNFSLNLYLQKHAAPLWNLRESLEV